MEGITGDMHTIVDSNRPTYEELLQTLAEKEAAIVLKLIDRDFQLGIGLLLSRGLPPLGSHYGSSHPLSDCSTCPLYGADVQARDGDFSVLYDHSMEKLPHNLSSHIWKRSTDGRLGIWNNETHLQSYVSDVLIDVFELAGLNGEIRVCLEAQLSVTDHRQGDMLVLRKHGLIIGFCYVKRPCTHTSTGDSDLDNDMLRRQISNYMQYLKHSYGLKAVFGIVTTYNKWKFHI
mmetsp:Transcript_7191/g.10688  ORF Transcript_7191/g.10688 Transcript_7191/m.10688 type:complete len:232 (-) Transcript_7191:850-1545(-)